MRGGKRKEWIPDWKTPEKEREDEGTNGRRAKRKWGRGEEMIGGKRGGEERKG